MEEPRFVAAVDATSVERERPGRGVVLDQHPQPGTSGRPVSPINPWE